MALRPASPSRRPVLFMAALFLLAAAAVLGKSLLDADGYLFDDSTQYLKLARALVDGRGFYTTPCDYESDKTRVFFAVWPVGYPVLIALVSKLTATSVVWASKLANLLALAWLMVMLRRSLGRAAPAAALVLLFAPFLEMFTFTMSEAAFMPALVAFCLALNALLERPDARRAVWLAAAALLVFLFRYIGAFAFGICFLAAFAEGFRGRRKTALILAATGLAVFLAEALYLALNTRLSGFPTGLMRSPSFFTVGERLTALARALIFMVNPMALEPLGGLTKLHALHYAATAVLLILIAVWFRLRTRAEWIRSQRPWDTLEQVLLLTGAVDWAAVLVMHGTAQVDTFRYRLFAPGALLFLLAAFRRLERVQTPRVFELVIRCLLLIALVSYVWHGPLKTLKHRVLDGEPDYAAMKRGLEARYADIPPNSAVIGGSSHLNYLRPDLRILYPYFGPRRVDGRIVFYRETLEELTARAENMPYDHVYLDVPETRINRNRMHSGFGAFADANAGPVVTIR